MTYLEDLMRCFGCEYEEDVLEEVTDWLMDFARDELEMVVSDAAIKDYLLSEK